MLDEGSGGLRNPTNRLRNAALTHRVLHAYPGFRDTERYICTTAATPLKRPPDRNHPRPLSQDKDRAGACRVGRRSILFHGDVRTMSRPPHARKPHAARSCSPHRGPPARQSSHARDGLRIMWRSFLRHPTCPITFLSCDCPVALPLDVRWYCSAHPSRVHRTIPSVRFASSCRSVRAGA